MASRQTHGNSKSLIFDLENAPMASQQPPGDSKPIIMDSRQPPTDFQTINIALEKNSNGFAAPSSRFQTMNNGFTETS